MSGMNKTFYDFLGEVEAFGQEQVTKGEAQLAEFKKDPVKNAQQIKFLELALGQEKKVLEGFAPELKAYIGKTK